jgi:hypothetical protein
LAIVEMTESVAMRYVNGKYIWESDYVPPKASRRHVDHTWTTNRDLPSGRLRLLVYSPYRSVSWSTSFQESKARSLTSDIPQIVKAIENATATVRGGPLAIERSRLPGSRPGRQGRVGTANPALARGISVPSPNRSRAGVGTVLPQGERDVPGFPVGSL